MKSVFLIVCVVIIAGIGIIQTGNTGQTLEKIPLKRATGGIRFFKTTHDFGVIKQGIPVNYDFAFENASDQPVVIEYANASCGCTVPGWSTKPITKGEKGVIAVGFNAAVPGRFDKTIIVKVANHDNLIELHITGEVLNTARLYRAKSSNQQQS